MCLPIYFQSLAKCDSYTWGQDVLIMIHMKLVDDEILLVNHRYIRVWGIVVSKM